LDSPRTPLAAGLLAVDWVGSIAIVGATLALLLGLEFGGVIFAWSSVKVICLIIFGVVIGLGFLFNEAIFARYPLMPLRLFKSMPNAAALAVAFLHGLVGYPIYKLKMYPNGRRLTLQHHIISPSTPKRLTVPRPFNPVSSSSPLKSRSQFQAPHLGSWFASPAATWTKHTSDCQC
jgi:hypothetical protein